jgi:hypothetical protein
MALSSVIFGLFKAHIVVILVKNASSRMAKLPHEVVIQVVMNVLQSERDSPNTQLLL